MIWRFIRTFPEVLERLYVGSVKEPWSISGSCTPGDHARFFVGDDVREEDGNGGVESFTGAWVIRFPRRVCVVTTSYTSGFCPESLIFGIEGLVYRWMTVCNLARRCEVVIDRLISGITSTPVRWFINYHIHACGGCVPDSLKCINRHMQCLG